MTTCIETIFDCTQSDEVLRVLEAFLHDFAQSGFSSQISPELRPVRICSSAEVISWSRVVRIAVEQRVHVSSLELDCLSILATVLNAASRRIEFFAGSGGVSLSGRSPVSEVERKLMN